MLIKKTARKGFPGEPLVKTSLSNPASSSLVREIRSSMFWGVANK